MIIKIRLTIKGASHKLIQKQLNKTKANLFNSFDYSKRQQMHANFVITFSFKSVISLVLCRNY